MSITLIRLPEAGTAPVLHCDVCGKRIEDAEGGYVVWKEDSHQPTKVLFIHRAGRFQAQEERCDNSREFPQSMSLTAYLFRLLHNLKFDATRAEKECRDLEGLS